MGYTDLTLKKLFALSGNRCAFPSCDALVLDSTHGVLTGQICHIKGKHPGSARYDKNMTDAKRDDYENLIVMCGAHHKIIDDEETRDDFLVELLHQFKQNHEARNQSTVIQEDIVERLVRFFESLPPARPKTTLTPVIEWLLVNPDHQMGLDYYDFRVEVRNDGPKTVRDYRIDVEIPKRYKQNAGSYTARVDTSKPDVWLFRHQLMDSMPPHEIHPEDTRPVFNLSYVVARQHYLQGITEAITVCVYSGDELVATENYPIAAMLNAEQVELILGPRLAALKEIYETARAFYGDETDLTSEIVFVSEEPGGGKRSANLGPNAYRFVRRSPVRDGSSSRTTMR